MNTDTRAFRNKKQTKQLIISLFLTVKIYSIIKPSSMHDLTVLRIAYGRLSCILRKQYNLIARCDKTLHVTCKEEMFSMAVDRKITAISYPLMPYIKILSNTTTKKQGNYLILAEIRLENSHFCLQLYARTFHSMKYFSYCHSNGAFYDPLTRALIAEV